MAEMGLRILYVGDGKNDGESAQERDRAKYLREQYWLRHAPWPGQSDGQLGGAIARYRLRRSELGRNFDSPGDGFDFYGGTEVRSTGLRWTEVTEVYESNDLAARVNAFIRSRLRLTMSHKSRGIDVDGFESAIDTSLPSTDREKNMVDKVDQ